MTEIKTAQAWLAWTPRGNVYKTSAPIGDSSTGTVVIVHGLTEAEVHDAAALLAKSREVCEHRDTGIGTIRTGCDISYPVNQQHVDRPCWCGRKVVVK